MSENLNHLSLRLMCVITVIGYLHNHLMSIDRTHITPGGYIYIL